MIMMIGNAENRDSADIAGGNDAGGPVCALVERGRQQCRNVGWCVVVSHGRVGPWLQPDMDQWRLRTGGLVWAGAAGWHRGIRLDFLGISLPAAARPGHQRFLAES